MMKPGDFLPHFDATLETLETQFEKFTQKTMKVKKQLLSKMLCERIASRCESNTEV